MYRIYIRMFTDVYLMTTDPRTSFQDVFCREENLRQIFASIVFHTTLYCAFFNLAYYIFYEKVWSVLVNMRMIVALLVIMWFGFIGRFYHVKEVYAAYHGNGEKTREHLDKLYIGWIFIS